MTTITRTKDDRVLNFTELQRTDRVFLLHEPGRKPLPVLILKIDWKNRSIDMCSIDKKHGYNRPFWKLGLEPGPHGITLISFYLTLAPMEFQNFTPEQRSWLPLDWWAKITKRLMK